MAGNKTTRMIKELKRNAPGAPQTPIATDIYLPNHDGGLKYNNERRSYGSMYNHDVSTTVTIGAINTPVRIPSGFVEGQTNNTTFQNAREIIINKKGKYLLTWQMSFTTTSAAKEIEGFVMVDNILNEQASAHRYIGTGTDTGSMSGACVLDLEEGEIISVGVLNETTGGSLDVIIEHANLSLVEIG
ncbi:hypothetical protein KAR91_82095 [Candidatus Pacearchaeota archaeon]|nr:hypothetical protein [Candidatus Pacearchaeota archaeon]